jgi:TnpA family transposase
MEIVSGAWKRRILGNGKEPDWRSYTLCILECLQDSLRRRDVFVSTSERWGDPRAKLLRGAEWEEARPSLCRVLNRDPDPKPEIAHLTEALDAAYRTTAANLPQNTAVQLDPGGGFTLSHLDKLPEPTSLERLRQRVTRLLPRVDLPEILLEINVRTGFTSEFTHLSESSARTSDLCVSLCAVLLSQACNIGLEPLVRKEHPALSRDRLEWVQHNFLRAETLTRANALLVEAQSRIGLTRAWGGGEVASADGLRFVVPVRTLHAGPNPKYFNAGRGITYYNFTSNQFSGLHGIIIPGTTHEGPYILEGLLEQQTVLRPIEVMADTAAYSDLLFGLFWLLGYQFSPRLADVGEARLWRIDPTTDYGVLNGLARQRVNTDLISKNWDDLLRVAGSLKMNTICASELIRSLLRGKRPSVLTRAIAELGRIPKTLYLLHYMDDEAYRRRILVQLNRHEGRHSLAREVAHGRRGELRQRYREGQEDQLGALGLVVNVIVLWNTLYMDVALDHLRERGETVNDADVARLSPLGWEHINLLGRYLFALSERILRGELRPLLLEASSEPY